jgi:hypothetical protein
MEKNMVILLKNPLLLQLQLTLETLTLYSCFALEMFVKGKIEVMAKVTEDESVAQVF